MDGSRILVATDLSDNAVPAARWALAMGEKLGLPVSAIHIVDIALRSWKGAYNILNDKTLTEKACNAVMQWFDTNAQRRPDSVILEVGSPLKKIGDVVADQDVALLVVGMSGKGAWNKFIFGSTAAQLSHTPPCPLVVVHPEHKQVPEKPVLAMGTDFTDASDAAIGFAAGMAGRLNVALNILHASILPSITVISDADLPGELSATSVVKTAETAMERFIDAHEKELEGINYGSHLITDYPVRGLMEFVADNHVDLLILGHCGGHGAKIGKLNSVAMKALQNMNTTIALVPVANQ